MDTLAIGHDDHDGGHDDDCDCDHNQDNDKQPCIISDDPVILYMINYFGVKNLLDQVDGALGREAPRCIHAVSNVPHLR